ncbi:MAG: carboxypeptidase-like regulatory domain-containing protein, partial [bacterium]
MRDKLKEIGLSFLALVVILLMVNNNSLMAQIKGKIAGKIYDVETQEPLPGANILIEGTTMGAAADINGEYFILNVPPGKFTVVASMMGYVTQRKTEALVQVGLTTYLDFAMEPTVIEGAEVTIVAERPVVQLDVGSSLTILESEEIAAIPVTNFKEVLDKQVGIQEMDARGLFMRGQRQSEISLMVDGMQTREQVDEQVYTRFNPDEIEQAEISASGYEVAYGNATAGVINLVTKEGGQSYSGTFDFRQSRPLRKHFGPPIKYYWDKLYMDEWLNTYEEVDWKDTPANRWEIFAHNLPEDSPFKDRPGLLQELYRWRFRDEVTDYGQKSDYVLSATFGGPVPFLKKTTFFSSYRREKNYYLYPGPLDHFFDQNGMFKITTRPTANTKLSLNFRYTETTGLNRYDYFVAESQYDLANTEETG